MKGSQPPPEKRFGRCFVCGKQKKRTRYQTCYRCRALMGARRHQEGSGR